MDKIKTRDEVTGLPTWSLCVATLNRLDELKHCVSLALAQTRPPSEILVCDASETWEAHKSALEQIVAGSPGIPLTYLKAERKSSTFQRNQCIAKASADILFLIDDDSFMLPDCAEKIVGHYAADTAEAIAAIATASSSEDPRKVRDGAKRITGMNQNSNISKFKAKNFLLDWVWQNIFLMKGEGFFVFYDDGARRDTGTYTPIVDTYPRTLITGWSLTVRREVAQTELFDPHLLAYCPSEDADATHRYARHGILIGSNIGRIYHMNTASSRMKRRQISELQVANMAYFIRRNSLDMTSDLRKFNILVARRILAEFLKDGLSRRFSLPQVRGVIAGHRRSRDIFRHNSSDLGPWYEDLQKSILAPREADGPPASGRKP